MKLKEIHRTSTFAWSPEASLPLLATGTVAGALDESFSNESQLELWAPNFLDKDELDLGSDPARGPKAFVSDTARFNSLAWGYIDPSRPRGVIAAGLENGELALWDPSKILAGQGAQSLIFRNTTHTGPVRGLDFNPIQNSLLASGGVAGEVYIWDLKDPSKPYTPTGTRSTKLDEITSVAWNQQVQYVLAGSSSTGYTVVWDLRGKREVVALAYGGGAGTLSGQVAAGGGLAVGGRRGMSDIAWHPDNATRLVTASEDDSSPIIMVWDLRNARAPEKILTGHEKGVLSLSWCTQDADLLLSCGKDNRALCWNPQTSEIVGELPAHENWAFQVDWCPRNPDLLAAAFFDGTIGIHSVHSTNEPSTGATRSAASRVDGSDIFDAPGYSQASPGGSISLKQPPKWLRCPISSSFGFGGQLTTVSNLPNAQGKNQSSVVHIRKVVTERDLVERVNKLQGAVDENALQSFAEAKVTGGEGNKDGWKALLSLFNANSRDELVTLLGFSKEEVAKRVAEAIENLKLAKSSSEEVIEERTHEPVVSFAEPERQEVSDDEAAGDKTPSEISASVTSDAASGLRADGESTTTVPSLFGDDDAAGTPQLDTGADFFNTVEIAQSGGNTIHVPHTNYGLDSSVAATIGSGPSSVTSEALKNNSFKIYPTDESETDRLITKALVLGDFDSAVSLCLSSERYADAILLAARGGPELLKRTQKAYFERRTTALPYLRLFQSIVTNDLIDIVQNADLQEWQEIFVVLCTFASREEFSGLAEQLGARLEFHSTVEKSSEDPEVRDTASRYRKNATLTYLASARLERLINIWIEESAEEENGMVADEDGLARSYYSAHAHALQSFIEKVTVFRSATKYNDDQLTALPNNDTVAVKTFKLAQLYDRYFEYANFLSTQGLVKEALAFVKLVPLDYKGSGGADLASERERILAITGVSTPTRESAAPAPVVPLATQSHLYPPTHPQVPAPVVPSPATTAYSYQQPMQVPGPYGPSISNTYAPPHGPTGSYGHDSPYPTAASLTQPPHLRTQHSAGGVPPPPRHTNGNVAPPPPPKRQDNGGWNDAPMITPSRTPANAPPGPAKATPITSPFPNVTPSPTGSPYMSQGQANLPPPPRPGSVQGRQAMPPPPGSRMSGPPQPSNTRSPSTAMQPLPPMHGGGVPPSRILSPASQGPLRQPTPSQYAPPPSRAPPPGQVPPPSQFARPPPPGSGPYARATPPPAPIGPYAPPTTQQQPTPYAPPPNQPQHQGSAQYAPPPAPQGQQGPYAPPPGSVPAHLPPPPPSGAGGPPPPRGPGAPGGTGTPSTQAKAQPPPPKYPPGDRSHIPEKAQPAYQTLNEHLQRLKQSTPPQQKRLADDVERRVNSLFDALNCETLSEPVVDQLVVLTKAMAARDRPAALAIHVDILTRGSPTDEVGIWMSAVKQLIMRL
ncbi:hypothetical protein AGABI2DRAFT_225478 [Agaricus bisporus var. bisporus H97]|uniref:hypothetical protein n=1 Tax=Agaricus bisporus var. bisporus (strain H97 / ATCC MYA-4626 / FGSC 10389) TaxID=936046 RepID=UPI00029F5593|nr:hypothetical protein AGABI2DRAFT_225478 [Agaricus bisporus var. bisporus H97]EKV44297.1 hypothetical protein AGABI2DRAFT_225478 [Agaricus bisporus var. bisporus H97]